MENHLLQLRSVFFDGLHGETIRYIPKIAGAVVEGIRASRSYDNAESLGSSGSERRQLRFEIRHADLGRPPLRDDVIDAEDHAWRVIHVHDRPEIGVWILNVEAVCRG